MQHVNLVLNSIQHIGLPVTDIKHSVSFYEKLGFVNAMEAPFTHHGETGTAVMMKRGNMIMELYQLPERELAAIASRKDGHVDHVAFDVPDIEAAFSVLKEAGYEIVEEEPVFLAFWENGCRYFNILGPDGERLEFNQII